jgi:hypothetical protein
MRQIFSSPRIENVEEVERLLEEAGIQTRVTDRTTWNRATKRDFSYTAKRHTVKWPAVWVVQADDYSRARQLMRELGLLQSDRESSYFLPPPSVESATETPRGPGRTRLILLGVAVFGAMLVALRLLGFF